MKRYGNLYDEIISIENLKLAHFKASKGKRNKKDVIKFSDNLESNLLDLHNILKEGTYRTSKYYVFKLFEKKEREIYKLPYFPDRIVHHAIMNFLEKIFVTTFTNDTYSCIKKRGIHKCSYNLRNVLRNQKDARYCLKIDIKKFYPNINHSILKVLLRRKIKDYRLLNLLDEIIDSSNGIPIGNYLSQYFANFYLTYFDHWLKEDLKIKYYFRYCDDIVILSGDKSYLHRIRKIIQDYLRYNLKLELSNYQVFPIESRGIDFVGYRHFHTHILLRKSIKKNWIRMLNKYPNLKSIVSYNGWLKHCNSKNLKSKYLKQ